MKAPPKTNGGWDIRFPFHEISSDFTAASNGIRCFTTALDSLCRQSLIDRVQHVLQLHLRGEHADDAGIEQRLTILFRNRAADENLDLLAVELLQPFDGFRDQL